MSSNQTFILKPHMLVDLSRPGFAVMDANRQPKDVEQSLRHRSGATTLALRSSGLRRTGTTSLLPRPWSHLESPIGIKWIGTSQYNGGEHLWICEGERHGSKQYWYVTGRDIEGWEDFHYIHIVHLNGAAERGTRQHTRCETGRCEVQECNATRETEYEGERRQCIHPDWDRPNTQNERCGGTKLRIASTSALRHAPQPSHISIGLSCPWKQGAATTVSFLSATTGWGFGRSHSEGKGSGCLGGCGTERRDGRVSNML